MHGMYLLFGGIELCSQFFLLRRAGSLPSQSRRALQYTFPHSGEGFREALFQELTFLEGAITKLSSNPLLCFAYRVRRGNTLHR